MSHSDVVVIGCSLDGVRLALQHAAQGRDVIVCDEGPGMTSLWPGFFDVFGPTAPPPPPQLAARFARAGTRRVVHHTTDPQRRLDRLAGDRPDHACSALDFDAERVREAFAAWVEMLEIPGTFHASPVLVPTLAGTLRYVDFTAEGMGWLTPDRTTMLGLEMFPQWSPEWAARMADEATGRTHGAKWVPSDAAPAQSTLAIAGAVDRGIDPVGTIAPGSYLLPPVLGLTFDGRRAAGERLASQGVDALEIAGGAESAFGVRLHRHLRALLERSVRLESAVVDIPRRDGRAWLVETRTGTIRAASVIAAFDAVAVPDWAEPWLEPSRRWPNNTSASPWEPQRFDRMVSEVF
jgi:glycine/D-amino acid oxidase-like deaminating enzyme